MQNLMVRDSQKQNPEMEDLFWEIFNCKNEEELHKLVTTNQLLKNDANWFPYGGKDENDKSNFGTFENQQPHPVPALIEKITNSIDSLLTKECRLRQIHPKSSSAPRSMAEAVEKFFNIKNGDFSEINEGDRRGIAENIQIIATGDKASPNILIYDNGEGQHPDDFKRTFLSIAQNNKTDIHFVQGKYNMGSTGAVVFCGKQRYQLIGSKLNEGLSVNSSADFGFTLIRRHPLTLEQEETCRTSWYEYFRINSKIPRFSSQTLNLGLYNRHFTTGSIVKLYSYQLPSGSRSDITLDLWRDLNQYLYQPALPILVYEKRFLTSHTPSKLVLGNKTRITLDDRDKKEKTITISFSNSEIGAVSLEATVFNHNVKQREFIKDKSVIFTVNGQVHGSLPRSFISQKLGLSLIRDYLLIQIDCTDMRASFRQDLFMANRHNLKESNNLEKLIKLIIEKIKSDGQLKELNEIRKNRIFHDNTQDKDLIKTLVKNIPVNDDLINLLKKNGDMTFFKKISNKGNDNFNEKNKNHEKDERPKVSKRYPSIFKIQLKENVEGKKIKTIPLNGKGVIKFETDVENEYLFRPKDKGELKVEILGHKKKASGGGSGGKPTKPEDIFDITKSGPTDNSIKIMFEPNQNLSVGDEVEINARLSSPDGDLESIFYIRIIDPQKTEEKPKEQKNEEPNLPEPVRVYEKIDDGEENTVTWADIGEWTGDDIVKLVISGEKESSIEKIAVNMDSFALKRYLSKNKFKSEAEFRAVKNKYFTTIYFHSLYLYGIIDKQKNTNEELKNIDAEFFIPEIFKYYSNVLLYSMNIGDDFDDSED